jgi:hypothetical protein
MEDIQFEFEGSKEDNVKNQRQEQCDCRQITHDSSIEAICKMVEE